MVAAFIYRPSIIKPNEISFGTVIKLFGVVKMANTSPTYRAQEKENLP